MTEERLYPSELEKAGEGSRGNRSHEPWWLAGVGCKHKQCHTGTLSREEGTLPPFSSQPNHLLQSLPLAEPNPKPKSGSVALLDAGNRIDVSGIGTEASSSWGLGLEQAMQALYH